MIAIKPPHSISVSDGMQSVFLAGTIDMGTSVDWQKDVTERLSDKDICIFNPLRDDFDASMLQSINNPDFTEQVDWELDALDKASVILMYFVPGSKSPISLLELGLYASSGRMIVCCPPGFWRKGNVEVVCNRFNVPLFEDLNSAIEAMLNKLTMQRIS